ncbi:MAG: DUF4347 domain-containing protein, partial [Proteobacteria bacterium]|nr:DUF4347 domain-containing protein [Pseudomonadota bacterium]MBU1057049.1 DUF4347 domain-containing protein [Pseudomonadota bacterium]
MKRRPLLLEQLEERIFLDANPLIPGDLGGDPGLESLAVPLESAAEAAAPEAENLELQPDATSSESELSAGDEGDQEESEGRVSEQVEPETPLVPDVSGDDSSDPADEVGETSLESPVEEVPAAAGEDEDEAETDQLPEGRDVSEETLAVPQSDEEDVPLGDVRQVVFVDSSVADHTTLLDGIVADIMADSTETGATEDEESSNEQTYNGVRIVILDSSQDEFQQVTDTLAGYTNLEGVHILSHGSNSSLRLGDTTLDSDTLDEHADQLRQWGEALSEDGDLLLYGCNVAEDGTGLEFIESVATLTGADVAASNDATGNATSGGDWDLEVATGAIETDVLHDASGAWDGLLAPPDPLAGGSATDTQPMLNSQIGFSITFDNDLDNDDADEGYGPYLDVVIPVAVDVQGDPTVYGSPVTYQTFIWNGTAWEGADGQELTEHPFDSNGVVLTIPTGTDNGDTWYLIETPFGSFVRDQPVTSVDFTADISTASGAVAGEDLEIISRAGFRYGDTPTNDNGPLEQADTHTITITPRIIDIAKSNDAPEDQTVTGPNYPVEYTLTVNIANGETVDDVVVTDYLPENAVYRGDVAITAINGAAVIAAPAVTEPTAFTVLGSTATDRLLEINLGSLTGVADPASGTSEYEITYTVYFSNLDSNGQPLLDPATGDDENVLNESSITGTYNGNPVTDGADTALDLLNDDSSDSITPSDSQIEIDSIVVYKDGSNLHDGGTETVAGDVIEWRLEVDVSDYFGVGNVVLDDVFGDGQTFIDGVNEVHVDQLVPTLEIYENGVHTATIAFDAANYTVGLESDLNAVGDTSLQFRISDQLVTMGQDAYLDGGYFADSSVDGADAGSDILNGRIGGDGTHVYIVYRTVVDQDYDKLHLTADYSGDSSVDIGDIITNDVTVTADIVESVIDRTVIGSEADLSSASTSVPDGDVLKEIYAVNGDTTYDISQGVMTGDQVTYHLQMTMPTADFEQLHITDFFPLPAYDVLEISTNTGNDFDGIINYSGGEIEFGPLHNLNSISIPGLEHNDSGVEVGATPIAPDLTVDTANNSLFLDFGSYDTSDPAAHGVPVVIDILITVTIQNNPMVDELLLTNQGAWTLNDTNLSPSDQVDITPIKLNEPVVNIVKGVVYTDNGNSDLGVAQGPAELTFNADGTIIVGGDGSVDAADLVDNPVDADLANADGSDLVTFAITVYNTGGSDAFDIHVTDTLPTGFLAPVDLAALNLNVYDGTGTLLTEGGTGDYSVLDGDFFTNGIDFHSTALGGNPADRGHDGGQDVFIITYQLQVDNETVITPAVVVNAGSSHVNEARVDFYTGQDDGTTDWTDKLGEPTDTATVNIAIPQVEKHLIATEISTGTNANNEAVIGEQATYQVTITLPEGFTPGTALVDTLDPGLTFVSLDTVSALPGLTTSIGDGNINTTNVVASVAGQVVTFDLGDLSNVNDDDSTLETITLTYTVFVNNSATADNQSGDLLDNSAVVTFTGGQSNMADGEDITVIEPDLEVLKSVVVDGGGTTGDAGDTVEYTITIQHTASSETDA